MTPLEKFIELRNYKEMRWNGSNKKLFALALGNLEGFAQACKDELEFLEGCIRNTNSVRKKLKQRSNEHEAVVKRAEEEGLI
jgi:hypothetical protein|tara:strand:+ start:179 stop:424 length:246 start_codon:yes stop_codon:yes gene_type:complete